MRVRGFASGDRDRSLVGIAMNGGYRLVIETRMNSCGLSSEEGQPRAIRKIAAKSDPCAPLVYGMTAAV
jgi:hypothetical protein